jgi:hypothetical protein
MRWRPIVVDVILMVVVWTAVLGMLRQWRARVDAGRSGPGRRSYRLQIVASITATVGITWLLVWFITDTVRPHWLHTLSAGAALIFVAVAAFVFGYAGWVGNPGR